MTGLLEKLGQNFLVATFIPSLGFVLIGIFFFQPIFPPGFAPTLEFSLSTNLAGDALLLFVLTILLGFTLQGLNTFIYKLLEGYFFLNRFSWLLRRQRSKANRSLEQIRHIDQTLKILDERETKDEKFDKLVARLKLKSFSLKAQYKLDYPPYLHLVLPTRFGNILRAAEIYSGEHYGVDAVLTWPRLIHVIEPSYYNKLDQSNNGLAFIVNSMVLSLAMVIFCLLASLYQFYAWNVTTRVSQAQLTTCSVPTAETSLQASTSSATPDPISLLYFLSLETTCSAQQAYIQRGWIYLVSSIAFAGIVAFFYNASLPAARQYGALIRSAYDLFRFDLRRQLRLTLPRHSHEEHESWAKWTEFIALGSFAVQRLPFRYQYDSKEVGVALIEEDELYWEFLDESDLEEE